MAAEHESSDHDPPEHEPSTEADEVTSCLKLQMVRGIGPRIYADLIERFGSAADVLSAAPSLLREVPGVGTKLLNALVHADEIDVDPVLRDCREHRIEIVHQGSGDYPDLLSRIYDPPSAMFCRGSLLPSDAMAIAIVGTRHATSYGKRVAEKLARGLSMAGFTIVSGMARGIDAAAHRAALAAGGRTIAVLGSGLLNIYPPEHAGLAEEIAAQGAVLTESLPHHPPRSGSFPRRNRIVTGMSLGVIVIEAGDRSGAMISARLAMEQNREVFAVPGSIESHMSRGCHRLIRDGATLVESVDDVLEQLGPLATPVLHASNAQKGDSGEKVMRHPAELKLSEQERLVLDCIETEPTAFDVLIEKTDLPAARILATLSVLEIRRLIRRLSSTSFIRI